MVKKLNLNCDEITSIRRAVKSGHTGWSNKDKSFKHVKKKIKKILKKRTNYRCCYCERNLIGEFDYVLDIEHIIPKSKCLKHMFTMKNLSVSCKRCNMKVKGCDTSFLNFDINLLPKNVFKSKYYKFVHPNLDVRQEHIKMVTEDNHKVRLVHYLCNPNSEKAKYTFDYFNLNEFQIKEANKSQGIKKSRIKDKWIDAEFQKLLDNR
ncbi:hypothetical protein VT25_08265 [Photobacterium leiognathi subsp. mandapamensis]|nr:hypothetical protein VT25_08265 [Photobacterium leiognathi subsp. mandapamensis]